MSKKSKVSSSKKASNKKVDSKKSAKKDKKTAKASKPVVKPEAKKAKDKKIVTKTKVAKKPTKVTKPAAKAKPAKPTKIKKPVTSTKKVVTKKSNVTTKKVVVKSTPKKIKVVAKPAKTIKPISVKSAKVHVKTKPVATKKAEVVKTKVVSEVLSSNKKTSIIDVEDTKVATKNNSASASKEVMAITNNIPQKKQDVISPSKIATISSGITNPIKAPESYSVKAEKEPAGKFEIEFVVKSSADMLYEFLYSNSGLSEWFCDDVNIRNGIYTFIWDGQMQQARLLKTIDNQLVRFQWVDKTDGSYFEFRIQHDDLTNDNSLIITDFADSNSEIESSKLLWQNQIDKLMHVIGSI